MKYDVLIARFPFGASEHPDTTDWLLRTCKIMCNDPRVGRIHQTRIDDTPITMGRNRVIKEALAANIDLLVMIDSDMSPDLPIPGAKPFWQSSFDFLCEHHGPCVIGAPYCGPTPHENVYVFRAGNKRSNNPNIDFSLDQYGREDAAGRSGFESVAALPTGLILIDMKAISLIKPPWFYYEWTDETQSEKASTEDVTFTRDLAIAGIPLYVNWDAWAGHWKRHCVGKPRPTYINDFGAKLVEAVEANRRSDRRMVMIREGKAV